MFSKGFKLSVYLFVVVRNQVFAKILFYASSETI
ncbi:hypothetical protein ZPR_2614 [Zunongwangia profunda SM-A87]|uniref:Uncharacterized protein n=1 Tax=Zunongwangia profunda (strain DSM 18752 / CCTCC AB 206139 / SM-A87) TaxID=655815 RepID=D5BF40_ZUNPS|nr:hypothetical protein ZPR_2614 [Zunongwangia profunda SM-A87]